MAAAVNVNQIYLNYLLNRRRLFILHAYRKRRMKSKRKPLRFWMRKLYEERNFKGEYSLLVHDLRLYDREMFFRYFRMTTETFEILLGLIAPIIEKKVTKMRNPISVDQRLLITLRYLTTGDAHTTIAANYRMRTVGRIISEACNALWDKLKEAGYIRTPSTECTWKKIANDFEDRWNFPNMIGAIDGKHEQMFAPAGQASSYFNYKKTHSIVLLGVCDANYKFTLVDIGDSGRQSDGSVYANSNLGYAIENKLLKVPPDSKITGSTKILPYIFVGDDAFGLKRHMMQPFPFSNLDETKLIFNYRLSRARRVIENTFGICASRFRVFHRPIIAKVQNVIAIAKAVVIVHNFLMSLNGADGSNHCCPQSFTDQEGPHGFKPGEWREDTNRINGLSDIRHVGASNNYGEDAKWVREQFSHYFNNEGAVDWQWNVVRRSK